MNFKERKQEFISDVRLALNSHSPYVLLESDFNRLLESYYAQFEGECKWKYKGNGYYIVGCDESKSNQTVNSIDFTYCPYCSLKIKRV
jgi:hypothetical protein